MSATDQMRSMISEPNAGASQLAFTDAAVCRSYLAGCCPHDILSDARMDMGSCTKEHDLALRADYERAQKERDYFYDVDALDHLERFFDDCDRKMEIAQKRLAETQEELGQEATEKADVVLEINEEIGKTLAKAEKLGEEGHVEESLKLMEQLEEMRTKKQEAEVEYRNALPASSYQQQKLRVCEVCGAYAGIHDNDRRLADHFGGKLHMGFVFLRDKLAELRTSATERRALRGHRGSDGGAISNAAASGLARPAAPVEQQQQRSSSAPVQQVPVGQAHQQQQQPPTPAVQRRRFPLMGRRDLASFAAAPATTISPAQRTEAALVLELRAREAEARAEQQVGDDDDDASIDFDSDDDEPAAPVSRAPPVNNYGNRLSNPVRPAGRLPGPDAHLASETSRFSAVSLTVTPPVGEGDSQPLLRKRAGDDSVVPPSKRRSLSPSSASSSSDTGLSTINEDDEENDPTNEAAAEPQVAELEPEPPRREPTDNQKAAAADRAKARRDLERVRREARQAANEKRRQLYHTAEAAQVRAEKKAAKKAAEAAAKAAAAAAVMPDELFVVDAAVVTTTTRLRRLPARNYAADNLKRRARAVGWQVPQ